eukprot:CAMPEP_0182476132 /NCGR_PEP_ID=MMETSP1319-20130603/28528_1 /TAXON_ID=172717 /ORGANISM="Bolidomonas pacifica, Strain RCC208" /LENGTH=402 /DNA_ID=CAMNT_0024677197 /DNA_START=117 /DNA_END=1321 /DNA_ORIENTATION=+
MAYPLVIASLLFLLLTTLTNKNPGLLNTTTSTTRASRKRKENLPSNCSSYDDLLEMMNAVGSPRYADDNQGQQMPWEFNLPAKKFTRGEMARFFNGRRILFVGNSNVRKLFRALLNIGANFDAKEQELELKLQENSAEPMDFEAVKEEGIHPYTSHSGFWVDADFSSELGEYGELCKCPQINDDDSGFEYYEIDSERERWSNEGNDGPTPHRFLLCDVEGLKPLDEGARFAFQFSSTPQASMVRQMASKISGSEADGGRFLTEALDDVVLQLDGNTLDFETPPGADGTTPEGFDRLLMNFQAYLELIKLIDESYRSKGKRLHFFLLDITSVAKTTLSGENLKLQKRWHKEVTEATAAFSRKNDVLVAFVPLMAGEVNDGRPMLRHERTNIWHWSRAGQFYQA